MTLFSPTLTVYHPVASDLVGDLSSLYSQSVVAGEPFRFTVRSDGVSQVDFARHYAIRIKGQS